MNAPACTICNRADGPMTHTKATGWRCSQHRPDPLAHLLETLRRWVDARERDTGREGLAAQDVEHAYRSLQEQWALHRAGVTTTCTTITALAPVQRLLGPAAAGEEAA